MYMFKKPRTYSSMDQLRGHLQTKGGCAPGILWEANQEMGADGLPDVEWDEPAEGTYSLPLQLETGRPIVEFSYDFSFSEEKPLIVTEDDVLRGAVQVIARRLK